MFNAIHVYCMSGQMMKIRINNRKIKIGKYVSFTCLFVLHIKTKCEKKTRLNFSMFIAITRRKKLDFFIEI